MKKKPVIAVAIINIVICIYVSVYMSTTPEEKERMLQEYRQTTSNHNLQVTVSQTIKQIEKKKEEEAESGSLLGDISSTENVYIPGSNSSTIPGPSVNTDNWYDFCLDVKRVVASYGLLYNQKGWFNAEYDGGTYRFRQDCTGYIGLCLLIKGYIPQVDGFWTGKMNEPPAGFDLIEAKDLPNGRDSLIPGDILFYSDHGEIFSHIDEYGNTRVLNFGSNSSAVAPGPTGTSHSFSQLLKIWRIQ